MRAPVLFQAFLALAFQNEQEYDSTPLMLNRDDIELHRAIMHDSCHVGWGGGRVGPGNGLS